MDQYCIKGYFLVRQRGQVTWNLEVDCSICNATMLVTKRELSLHKSAALQQLQCILSEIHQGLFYMALMLDPFAEQSENISFLTEPSRHVKMLKISRPRSSGSMRKLELATF